MSKFIQNSNSKLSTVEIPKTKTVNIPEQIITKKNSRTSSFSLRKKDLERLSDLLFKSQALTERKLTSTDVLRGLFIAGETLNTEDLLSCIQKSFME